MGDKSVNEPLDPTKVRFSWLEQQVADINHNVNLLMAALSNNLVFFREDGGSNAEEKSEQGSKDWGDTKNQRNRKISTHFECPKSIPVQNGIKSRYQVIPWRDRHFEAEPLVAATGSLFQHSSDRGREKYLIHTTGIEVHAMTWWESHTKKLRLEGELPVNKWEDFKTLIKSHFYPIGYVEDQWIQWHYVRQWLGQSIHEYTTKLRKMAIMLRISPKNPNVLLKYLGGLHCHLCEQVMLFKPKSVDEACV